MKKRIVRFFAIFLITLLVLVAFNFDKVKKLNHVIHLFDADVITQNFQNMEASFPSTSLKASQIPLKLPSQQNISLPKTFTYKDEVFNINAYLKNTSTEGLLIIKNDTIIYEDYMLDLEQDETHISWSMSKSFVATLIGVFVEQGKISLSDKVEMHVPEFKGTGYEGVTVKQLLNMSTGIKFNEDYGDYNSDINRFGRTFASGSSLLKYSKSLSREREPGEYNHYVSINTQVLGFILAKVSGKTITELTQEYL